MQNDCETAILEALDTKNMQEVSLVKLFHTGKVIGTLSKDANLDSSTNDTDVIVEKDGVFSIASNLNVDNIELDADFQALVNSVLHKG